jgi:tryptophan halogenase
MKHWPDREDPVLKELPREDALRALRRRRDAIAAIVAGLPAHDAYLGHVLGRAAPFHQPA